MRASATSQGMTVRGIAGTYTVLLGFDLTAEARRGCLGFSIERTEVTKHGEPVTRTWLENRLAFAAPFPAAAPDAASASDHRPRILVPSADGSVMVEQPVDFDVAAPTPASSPRTTERNPWQSFRYIDSTVGPGRRYQYRVVAAGGAPGALTSLAEVTVDVTTEDPTAKSTGVHFNRAAASSQQYRERFGDLDPDAPDVTNDPARNEEAAEARSWLSRGLEEALVAFMARARSSKYALHVAVYEFQKEALLRELVAASKRGAKVDVVYHHRNAGKGDDTWRENADAARASGLEAFCTPREGSPKGAISHNKFVVLLQDGAPLAVWTGSTNWTDGALYGQLNVGHVVNDPAVAQKYERYYQQLRANPEAAALREALARETPVAQVRAELAARHGVWPIFSPQATLDALTLYADICQGASCLMVCAPFVLHASIRDVLTKTDPAKGALRFMLLDKEGNLGKDQNVDAIDGSTGRTVSVAVTQKDPLHDFQNRLFLGNESFHHSGVHLHAKLILADPLGDDPIVVTGSANYSESSTTQNDENTLVIRGDKAVADIYLTEFLRMFDSYHFRGKALQRELAKRPLTLCADDRWSARYYPGSPASDPDLVLARPLFAGTAGAPERHAAS